MVDAEASATVDVESVKELKLELPVSMAVKSGVGSRENKNTAASRLSVRKLFKTVQETRI